MNVEHFRAPPTAIAVAWITRHPANMQVVLGTTNPQRVADAAAGSEIPLTRAEWYELFRTAGHIIPWAGEPPALRGTFHLTRSHAKCRMKPLQSAAFIRCKLLDTLGSVPALTRTSH